MLIKVYKSMISGLSDLDDFYINTDYIVSMEKNDNVMSIFMVNGYTYNIDEESYNRIIKLKSISNEEKQNFKVDVSDISGDVKNKKLEEFKKEMELINE